MGNEYRFVLSATQKRLVIDDEDRVPVEWLREEIIIEPDKAKIKEALEAGQEVDGCRLEGGYGIRSYKNNPTRKGK